MEGGLRGETIQSFIDSGDVLTAYCHNPKCHHHGRLDMMLLRDRLGPDHGSMHDDLVPKLKCSRCGGRKLGLIRSPDYDRIDRERSGKGLTPWGE